MSCERVEIGIETIAGEEGQAARSQLLAQPVDDEMGHLVGSRTQLKHRNTLGERIDSYPEPEHLCVTTQARPQFIQLQTDPDPLPAC